MSLHTIKVFALVGVAAALGIGLASCMQDGGRQTAAAVPQTPSSGYGLFYMDEGPTAKLAYGQANSDDVDLMLQCTKGSRVVQVTNIARNDGAPKLTLVSSGASADLNTRIEAGDGATVLVADAPMSSAPLSAFRRSGHLEVSQGGKRYGVTATANERAGVESFFQACGRA